MYQEFLWHSPKKTAFRYFYLGFLICSRGSINTWQRHPNRLNFLWKSCSRKSVLAAPASFFSWAFSISSSAKFLISFVLLFAASFLASLASNGDMPLYYGALAYSFFLILAFISPQYGPAYDQRRRSTPITITRIPLPSSPIILSTTEFICGLYGTEWKSCKRRLWHTSWYSLLRYTYSLSALMMNTTFSSMSTLSLQRRSSTSCFIIS